MHSPGFIIAGDTDEYEGCIVMTFYNENDADMTLKRMLTNPTELDKRLIHGYKNLRAEKVSTEDCWWRNA